MFAEHFFATSCKTTQDVWFQPLPKQSDKNFVEIFFWLHWSGQKVEDHFCRRKYLFFCRRRKKIKNLRSSFYFFFIDAKKNIFDSTSSRTNSASELFIFRWRRGSRERRRKKNGKLRRPFSEVYDFPQSSANGFERFWRVLIGFDRFWGGRPKSQKSPQKPRKSPPKSLKTRPFRSRNHG